MERRGGMKGMNLAPAKRPFSPNAPAATSEPDFTSGNTEGPVHAAIAFVLLCLF